MLESRASIDTAKTKEDDAKSGYVTVGALPHSPQPIHNCLFSFLILVCRYNSVCVYECRIANAANRTKVSYVGRIVRLLSILNGKFILVYRTSLRLHGSSPPIHFLHALSSL